LEDLEYAFDLALLSHSFNHISEKTMLAGNSSFSETEKVTTKIIKAKTVSPQTVRLACQQYAKSFSLYWGR